MTALKKALSLTVAAGCIWPCVAVGTAQAQENRKMEIRKLDSGMIENEGARFYHGWPTVANMGNDRLAAVCSGARKGHIDPYGRVLLYVSDDLGKTWQGPTYLTNGPLDDRDAGIYLAPDGSWLVNYTR